MGGIMMSEQLEPTVVCWRHTLHESRQTGPAIKKIIFSTVKAVYTFHTALTASLWQVVYMNLFWENSIRRDPRFLHKSLNLACVLIKKNLVSHLFFWTVFSCVCSLCMVMCVCVWVSVKRDWHCECKYYCLPLAVLEVGGAWREKGLEKYVPPAHPCIDMLCSQRGY